MRRGSVAVVLALAVASAACAGSRVPDAKTAIEAYARAAERGDSDALYGMMTEASQRGLTQAQLREAVLAERAELAEQARGLTGSDASVKAVARLRFEDGEEAALALEGGRFRVSAAGALPGGGRTPEEALDQLRRVLARRSYAGLMRVVTAQTRALIERDLRSLVEGLERSDTLSPQITGDSATVKVPGGHQVRLRRDGAIWRIDDFD
jgi:hypothetical protein